MAKKAKAQRKRDEGPSIKNRIVGLKHVESRRLKPHPQNWRRHPEKQKNALRQILEDVGWVDTIIARRKGEDYEIIDGHLRAELEPEATVPVLLVDLDDQDALKVLASHDPLAYLAQSDPEALETILRQIESETAELERLLEDADLRSMGGVSENAETQGVPEPPDDPVTRRGDLWILGDHRLLCGDSSSAGDLDRLLDGAPIHLCNTDPPYNVKVEPRSNNAIAAGVSSVARRADLQCERSQSERGKRDRERLQRQRLHHESPDLARHPEKSKASYRKMRAKDRPLENDFVSDEDFERMLLEWFGNVARVLLPGRCFYIWGGYANCANYPKPLAAFGLYFSQAIIWHKQHPVMTRKDFMGDHEWCFYGWREGAGHKFFGPHNATDVWSVKKINPNNMVHLTEKPVELALRAVQYSSRPGEHVLDLFGGSGSTLIACEQTERRAFLMELDPAYCDVIVKRWEQFTGREAERRPADDAVAT